MIKIEHLQKYFNRGKRSELHVLNDITLELPQTGLVCILGESGSGKTTLLNTIGGLDVFQGGTLTVDETILKKYEPKKIEHLRCEKFGYIFQNYYLLQDYTVAYNVKLALSHYDLTDEEKDERVSYVLEQLGIGRYKKKLVSKLSGGQQQRGSIARALVKSPQIILADEPTGNLDEENTIRTMSILRAISKECLVILVSHERRIAEFFADRILEIKDGEITKDYDNHSGSSYERSDDGNIYLPELTCQAMQSDENEIEVYQNADSKEEPIRLKMAWKSGKLYIRSDMASDVIFAGEEAGCEIFDEPRPKLEMEDVENFSYELSPLEMSKKSGLSWKATWRMTLENLKLLGKKQAFIVVILLITAIMLSLTISDLITAVTVHREEIVKDDSHYVQVEMKLASPAEEYAVGDTMQECYNKVLSKGKRKDMMFYDAARDLVIQADTLYQMRGSSQVIRDFSYVDISKVTKKDLLYGRLPKKSDEIVIDKLVADRFLKSDTAISGQYASAKELLGETLSINTFSKDLTVVGISGNNEASIYCSQSKLLGMVASSYSVMSLSELQKLYPGKYDNVTLQDDQMLVPQSKYDQIKSYQEFQGNQKEYPVQQLGNSSVSYEEEPVSNAGENYIVVGGFDNSCDVDYVLTDAAGKQLADQLAVGMQKIKYYVDDLEQREELVKQLQSELKPYQKMFRVKVTIPAEQQVKAYRNKMKDKTRSKALFAMIAVILSVLIIYYTIRSNASSRMEELTVYRLLGISKASIIRSFILEMLLINCYTTLPGVVVTTGVMKFAASVPSLGMNLSFPWWGAITLIAAIMLVNAIVSVIPVHNILAKPPAELAVK